MSKALSLSGGGAACNASACPTFVEQVKALVARDFERKKRRLGRLEIGERARASLSCQKDNISRKKGTYAVKNRTHYNRTSCALETNVARWVLSLGKKYSPLSVQSAVDNVGYNAELIDYIERKAKEHVAELTITIPHYENEDLGVARRRFTRAFNEFNKRVLKERLSSYFGDFVRVFEAHKDGVLHAHIIIECKQSLRRGSMPFRWRQNGNVDGSSVAPWVTEIWHQFRSGEFEQMGIGQRHTLQPIRKGVTQFSKYIAKYISKGLGARPEFMRGLRCIAYSQGFLDGGRLKPYDYDKNEGISYFSKTQNKWLTRYKRFNPFDIQCASRRVLDIRLADILRRLGLTLAQFKLRMGCKWAFNMRRLLSIWRVPEKVFAHFSK